MELWKKGFAEGMPMAPSGEENFGFKLNKLKTKNSVTVNPELRTENPEFK
jgi:hypothetical protein